MFIHKERREALELGCHSIARLPDDRCYKYYRRMFRQWERTPSWATADEIYKWVKQYEYVGPIQENNANQRAKELAWQVFFQLKVMPYVQTQRDENGDIES